MNKYGAGACALGWLMLAAPVMAGTGLDVNFKGALVDRMCMFAQGGTPLQVVFPNRAVKFFEAHPRSDTKSFVIELKDCTSATQNKLVDLTFSSAQTTVVDGTTMLQTEGSTGLVIALVDDAGRPVIPGTPVNVGSIAQVGNGSVNRFTLGAYVMAPPGVKVNAGPYQATTTFTLNYR